MYKCKNDFTWKSTYMEVYKHEIYKSKNVKKRKCTNMKMYKNGNGQT